MPSVDLWICAGNGKNSASLTASDARMFCKQWPTDIKYPLEHQNEWGLSNVYPLVNAGVFTILRETENSSSEDAAELQIRGVEFYPSGSV